MGLKDFGVWMLKICYFDADFIPFKSYIIYVLPEEPGKRVRFSRLSRKKVGMLHDTLSICSFLKPEMR